jgi:hypothetical protein
VSRCFKDYAFTVADMEEVMSMEIWLLSHKTTILEDLEYAVVVDLKPVSPNSTLYYFIITNSQTMMDLNTILKLP